MGKIIKGPDRWFNRDKAKQSIQNSVEQEPTKKSVTFANYPWHTLTAPPGTSDKEFTETLLFLQRLVNLGGDSGGVLMLPEGWFWDPKKNQSIIDELLKIADQIEDQDEIPDDIA